MPSVAEKRGPNIIRGGGVNRELQETPQRGWDSSNPGNARDADVSVPVTLGALAAPLTFCQQTNVVREAPDLPAPHSQSLTQSF